MYDKLVVCEFGLIDFKFIFLFNNFCDDFYYFIVVIYIWIGC